LQGSNTLAYFPVASVTLEFFYKIETCERLD
jgi:hypothetical protein